MNNRIIKFRARTVATGEWIYFDLRDLESLRLPPFIWDTVSEFVGLHDKNKNEIYEGDVVYLAGYGDYEVEFPFQQLFDAVAENDIGEIKGNVFENPELLNPNPEEKV